MKPMVSKLQGVPPKSRLLDEYVEIKDIDLRHMDLSEFVRVCNNPIESSTIMFALIWSGLVNAASHLGTVQSAELIMTLSRHFIPEERVVKSVTEEVVLDLQLDNIERVFHLTRADQFIQISYEVAERWYKDHHQEAIVIIPSLYSIEKPP